MWEFIRQVGGEAPNGLLRPQHLHMLVACRASAPIHQLELIAQHEHDQGGQISPADHLHRLSAVDCHLTLGTIRSEDCKRALQSRGARRGASPFSLNVAVVTTTGYAHVSSPWSPAQPIRAVQLRSVTYHPN